MYTWKLFGHVLKRFDTSCSHNGGRLTYFVKHRDITYGKFGVYRDEINLWFREQRKQVTQACRKQFEFITAQRIRRHVQVFYLYTRIWDEVALREFMRSWKSRITRNFLFSTIAVTMYNWDRERIGDEEINKYIHEIEGIHRLRECTVICAKCHLRIVVDVIQSNVKYCKCNGVQSTASNQNSDGWQPYIERQDMLIWRRQEPGGLYAYKVYGSFSDVTAEDFLQVQIDVDYRLEWDSTAKELEIIETDPQSKSCIDQSNDVIHWEMLWPRLFSNRDYVFQRRWIVNRETGIIIIVSRVTEHPDVPIIRGTYRVKSYWSHMVIRPYTEFNKPGIEFGLTYFDDPGVSVPTPVTSWVALRGLPDFLIRMRNASKNYQKYKLIKRGKATFDNSHPLSEEQVKSDSATSSTTELNIIHNIQQESDVAENGNRDTATNSSTKKQDNLT
ncbi:PREDICTED: stAR-related lipid transfer protein 7, mitochondrial-like isoform X2 [Dinoponera quadriceps]|uniref:Phosphatidylcholine transfer protein n=1 Tax=Dinoponera quadriceps TaxID=609295 RepID=A0A6P3YD58_DINQU|nr:PREDICTED: stAR-related lipid transfer protein 7, mitochondrial-like isoform X2 [Dinoponera quadriceps]